MIPAKFCCYPSSRAEGPTSRRRRQCGLLLQTRTSGVVCPSTRSTAIGAVVEQPVGQRTGSAFLFGHPVPV